MIQATVDRISAEFLEMPGLRLTVQQASRLWGLEPNRCKAILDGLVDAKFLCVKLDGSYARASEGRQLLRPQPARAQRNRTLASAS